MTIPPDPVSYADVALEEAGEEAVLPTFEVRARFAAAGASAAEAAGSLREALSAARGLYDDVLPERQEPDGTWLLEARFVVVSVDASTAVLGVQDTLRDAGLSPDEVWARV